MRKSGMISAALLAAVFVGLFTGCSGKLLKDMGSFKPSIEATENFKKFIVRSDYNYFISGSDVYPVAIFGRMYVLRRNIRIKNRAEDGDHGRPRHQHAKAAQ